MPQHSILATCVLLALALLSPRVAAVRVPANGSLIVGYTDWGECGPEVLQAIKDGVNVVIWFSILLGPNGNITGDMTNSSKLQCIGRTAAQSKSLGLSVTHLVSVGGWDKAHPDTSLGGAQWWTVFKEWNAKLPGFEDGFDGVDWDVEGEDTLTGSNNVFTLQQLQLMGDFSKAAKNDGFSISLTPCESYLDVYNPYFDLSLTHAYAEWPLFPYHGHNPYAYLVAKYGSSFDIINVQLYESWSHANYQINVVKVPAAAFLQSWARQIMFGWEVYFSLCTSCGLDIATQWVSVLPSQLVIGLANAWTGTADGNVTKALYVPPEEVKTAFQGLQQSGTSPRGVMFWDIVSEGKPLQGDKQPLWFAKAMNSFLHVRNVTEEGAPAKSVKSKKTANALDHKKVRKKRMMRPRH